MNIKLNEGAFLPHKATEGAAAYDCYIPEDVVIKPGRQIVPLGFAMEIPAGFEAMIEPRSGFSAKGMEDKNHERKDADVIPGKIDSDYRGIVGVIIKSNEKYPFTLTRGTRIAQMTFYMAYEAGPWDIVDELSSTDRGDGGFGSTGAQ